MCVCEEGKVFRHREAARAMFRDIRQKLIWFSIKISALIWAGIFGFASLSLYVWFGPLGVLYYKEENDEQSLQRSWTQNVIIGTRGNGFLAQKYESNFARFWPFVTTVISIVVNMRWNRAKCIFKQWRSHKHSSSRNWWDNFVRVNKLHILKRLPLRVSTINLNGK